MGAVRRGPLDWSAEIQARWQTLVMELRRRLEPGTPLEPEARARFESRIGYDLAGVVLHRGALAGQLADMLGGEALAVGSHVFGESARLEPTTAGGAALLGHELAHVVQQTRPLPTGGSVSAHVQRAPADHGTEDEEAAARSIETAIQRESQPHGPTRRGSVDPDELTERVYQRLKNELLTERERALWRG